MKLEILKVHQGRTEAGNPCISVTHREYTADYQPLTRQDDFYPEATYDHIASVLVEKYREHERERLEANQRVVSLQSYVEFYMRTEEEPQRDALQDALSVLTQQFPTEGV